MAGALRRGFLDGHALRKEDAQKVGELVPLLEEIARALPGRSERPVTLVDACAGKSALGVIAAALVLTPRQGPWRVVAIEREERRRHQAEAAAAALGVGTHVAWVRADVGDAAEWPASPDVVVALHACGAASDTVIDRAVAAHARRLLLVPCCYAAGPRHHGACARVHAQAAADGWARALPLPRHALVGKRFSAALIDAERTLRLEAAGYETEVLEVFPATLSPHNLLWRARRVGEPVRMADARARHAALIDGAHAPWASRGSVQPSSEHEDPG